MKKIFFISNLFLVSTMLFSQTVNKTMLRLPDTGETVSYTATLGEDNDYTINPPFFINNGDGTVNDTVTGLMWQKKDGGEMTIENAVIYCDTLSLGGYNDWRLPNAHEAFSILNHQHANPSLDATVFTVTNAEYWWTSDKQANDATKIWVTNAGGGVGNHPKTETVSAGGTKQFHVIAVRGYNSPTVLLNHFIDNGNGTITDNLTNLMWEKIPSNSTYTWEQGLTYAENLTLGNMSDWRMPNIKELQSICDVGFMNPAINTVYFNISGTKKYWSSTTLPNQTTKAWFWDTQFGITSYDLKTVTDYLICVRTATNTATIISESVNNLINNIVYPNPFKSSIHLKSKNSADFYELSNSFGQIIYSGKNIEMQDFSDIPKGMYFLKIVGKTTITSKIIKE